MFLHYPQRHSRGTGGFCERQGASRRFFALMMPFLKVNRFRRKSVSIRPEIDGF